MVVTGGDTVFSAGADVTELREMTPPAIADYYRASGSVYEVFAGLPQPTVAAITGYCLGGGLELALAADIRIADPAAVFGFPEIGIGILPSSGGVTRIVRTDWRRTRARSGAARQAIRRPAGRAVGLITEITPPASTSTGAGDRPGTRRALAVGAEHHQAGPRRRLDAPEAALLLEQLAYSALNNATDHNK